MTTDDFRRLLGQPELDPDSWRTPPQFVLRTRGGQSFRITHPTNAHISDAYPDSVVLLIRGRGPVFLALDDIETYVP